MPLVGRGVLALDLLEDERLAVADDLESVGVEGLEREEVFAPVVVRRLLEFLEERHVDAADRRLRQIADVHRVVVHLAADRDRLRDATGAQRERALRLVEAKLLQIGRSGVLGDDRFTAAV